MLGNATTIGGHHGWKNRPQDEAFFDVDFLTANSGCDGVSGSRGRTASVAGASLGEGLGMDPKIMVRLVPDPYVQGVGRVICQWSWVEAIIDQLIWRLLGVRALRGRAVTSNLLAKGKLELLATLMRKSRMKENLVKEIETRGHGLAAVRNLVAHGCVVVNPNYDAFGLVTAFRARGRLVDHRRMVTPSALEKVAEQIADFMIFLMENEAKFPKQRGLRHAQGVPTGTPRRRRPEAILQQLPPLLEVEIASVMTDAQMEAARNAKRAAKAEQRQRSLAGERKC